MDTSEFWREGALHDCSSCTSTDTLGVRLITVEMRAPPPVWERFGDGEANHSSLGSILEGEAIVSPPAVVFG